MGSYGTNKQGQTYGRIADSPSPEEPDLIAASGDGGTSGYIKKADLESSSGPSPATPEEAGRLRKNTP